MGTDMSKYCAVRYLKVDDLRESGPRVETIVNVTIQTKFDKPLLEFASGDLLSCNKTNGARLKAWFGKNLEDWLAQTVRLAIEMSPFNGGTEMIGLGREPEPPPVELAPDHANGRDLDDLIPF